MPKDLEIKLSVLDQRPALADQLVVFWPVPQGTHRGQATADRDAADLGPLGGGTPGPSVRLAAARLCLAAGLSRVADPARRRDAGFRVPVPLHPGTYRLPADGLGPGERNRTHSLGNINTMNASNFDSSWIARRPARWSMPVCLQPRAARRCRIVRAEDKRPVRQSPAGLPPAAPRALPIGDHGGRRQRRARVRCRWSPVRCGGPTTRSSGWSQDGRTITRYDLQFARDDEARTAAGLLVVAARAAGRPAGVRRRAGRLRAHAVAGRHAAPASGPCWR